MADAALTDGAESGEERLAPWLKGRSLEDWRAQLDRDGYIVFERAMGPSEVAAIREALAPHLERNVTGRNDFEGVLTNRVYALPGKGRALADLSMHPLALAFAEAELGPHCLLSACLAINIQPGESVQPWHFDDSYMTAPRPRDAYSLSAFWAIDDMTETNGATEIIPGSHLWPDSEFPGSLQPEAFSDRRARDPNDDPGARPDAMKAVMPSGSLMLAKGTLWHRGGANRSDKPRLLITPQYCVGWARQLENFCLSVPREVAAGLPERLQELLGYSICPAFTGYVDGVHPKKVLKR
ncbi:MAG: phytanoyl-CoA dioxygenase family protein [Maricaulaceae bacterium]|jgi:ectoine hydroxylase-related dioxygenase (phytanoyl-CoA dioxygenase family)